MEQDKEKMVYLDELVHDAISEWDKVFEDDKNSFEEETDIKDHYATDASSDRQRP